MKALLLNPPYREKMVKEGRCEQRADIFQTTYPPLTLAYLAAILRKKFDVGVLDCIARGYKLQKLVGIYLNEKPDLVFVNTTTQTIKNDLKIIKKLNNLHRSKFVIFGIYASYFRKQITKEGIATVPKSIEEYAYSLIGEKFDHKSPDSLPFPAWDLINLADYKLPLTGEGFVLLQTATGCPYECVFCTVPFYHGKTLKRRSVKSAIDEILYIKKLGISNVLFFADNFTLDKSWVKRLCKEIIRNKIKMRFLCNSRVDSVDRETLQLMKRAGCWLISFGIESGNQSILNKAKKRIKLEDSKRAVYEANKAGILTLGNFVIGLPSETQETIKETIGFANELGLDFVAFNIATPLPGSALYEQYKNKIIDFEKLEYSSQVISKELDLRYWQKKAYISFYSKKPVERFLRIAGITGMGSILDILKSASYLIFRVLIWRKRD